MSLSAQTEKVNFLPDLCQIQTLFALVLGGELLALVLALVPLEEGGFWNGLAMVSLFVQWVVLLSTALLCLLRPVFRYLSPAVAGIAGITVVLLVVLGLSEAAHRLLFVELPDRPGRWEYVLRNLGIGLILSAAAFRYLYIQFQWKRNLELESQARIQALQARIRPHFLFNSMNTIASLTRTRPELAERVVEDLADLFRLSFRDTGEPSTLKSELDMVRRYLDIEQLRLGERLQVEWDLKDYPGDARLPALSLQPLVENAVYHGIEPSVGGGTVHLSVSREGNTIRLFIGNPSPARPSAGRGQGSRMAQANVRERLGAFFGRTFTLDTRVEGDQYRLVLTFPYREADP